MMETKTVKVLSLRCHPDNPNQHPASQVKELQDSLKQFGQVKNIVVWNGQVIAGNGLLEAARAQKKDSIEVHDVSDWPEEKAIKFMITDNRLAELGIMDDDLLAGLLKDLGDPLDVPGIDEAFLDDIGFSEDDIEILESTGDLSGSQYGLAGSSTKVPMSILGIGGLVGREVMERVKKVLIENGAKEDQDNGELIKDFLLKGLL